MFWALFTLVVLLIASDIVVHYRRNNRAIERMRDQDLNYANHRRIGL